MAQKISTLRTGDGVPSNSIGVDGDYFFNTVTNNPYIRASGAYVSAAPGITAKQYASSGNYSYCGVAPAGSAQSSAVWSITRLLIDSAGNVTETRCATNVAWTNYLTATYSTCS